MPPLARNNNAPFVGMWFDCGSAGKIGELASLFYFVVFNE